MEFGGTVRHFEARFLKIQTLVIEVVDGPDQGVELSADCETVTVGTAEGNTLRLTDDTVSRYHFELTALEEGVRLVDNGSTNGVWLADSRIQRAIVQVGTVLRIGRTQLRIGNIRRAVVDLHTEESFGGLRGGSKVMRRLMAQMEKVATSDVPILLIGESGTGKEVVAQAIHDCGPRAKHPFITVDCASLTPGLVSSELFGHERGAFTGAHETRKGAFELASGGTLFLDELGELSADLQAHLLGVLERRRFRRVGGQEELKVDVRVISATNRDLRAEVNAGSFRLDLFYRVAIVRLSIPALRERVDDIPLLVQHFFDVTGHDGPVEQLIPPAAMAKLMAHRWPGNVRELRNLVEASLAMGELPPLHATSMPPSSEPYSLQPFAHLLDLPFKQARSSLLREFELSYLRRRLGSTDGNVSKAAREAQIDRSYLIELLRRHGLR